MLIEPDLDHKEIRTCLQNAYGLIVETIVFLPLGADLNAAVYKVATNNKENYFLKLRRGDFNKDALLIQKYLSDLGLKQIIPPLSTMEGQLWANLASFRLILYPYVEGQNANDKKLSKEQWIEFGETIKRFHGAPIPKTITSTIPRESFSPIWREKVTKYLNRIEHETFSDPIAAEMAQFLKSKNKEIFNIVNRAENLATLLQSQSLDYILCHADIHGWNLLIDEEGALYIVDWDILIFAPKERDLMFIGAGISDSERSPLEEEALFHEGYGNTTINKAAIAYYRYERIIEDIGVYCDQIFQSNDAEEDRAQSFEYFKSIFLPNGPLERACEADS